MKDKISNITFFAVIIGFATLVASVVLSNESMGFAALLLILPSITVNVAIRWINIENVDYFKTNVKDKVSIIAFFVTLIGFVVLVASITVSNEVMGYTALLIVLPSLALNVAMQLINTRNVDYFFKDKYNA